MQRFPNEAPTPQAATLHEVIRYYVNENERRAEESVEGLTADQVNHDPGHGAWSIGQLLKHQYDLIGMVTEALRIGSTKNLEVLDIGGEGDWNLDHLMAARRTLAECFFEVFNSMETEELMGLQPDANPPRWAEWPILMRILRPILDIATHIGQVNYARRQLGNPVGSGSGKR